MIYIYLLLLNRFSTATLFLSHSPVLSFFPTGSGLPQAERKINNFMLITRIIESKSRLNRCRYAYTLSKQSFVIVVWGFISQDTCNAVIPVCTVIGLSCRASGLATGRMIGLSINSNILEIVSRELFLIK